MTRFTFRIPLLVGALALATACEPAADDAAPEAPATQAPAATDTPAAISADTTTGALLDPDQATAEQLAAIPGMDAALAQRIIAGRPYADMLAVDRVLAEQLDETQRNEVYRHLWKPIDLNTASGEEIQLIPGVGDRMQHEFEEYRPYSAIEQFRREMGKYVDDEEVARLERYVTIR